MTKKRKQQVEDAAQVGRWGCWSLLAVVIGLHIITSTEGLW